MVGGPRRQAKSQIADNAGRQPRPPRAQNTGSNCALRPSRQNWARSAMWTDAMATCAVHHAHPPPPPLAGAG